MTNQNDFTDLGTLFSKAEDGLRAQDDFEEMQLTCERAILTFVAAWIFQSIHIAEIIDKKTITNQDILSIVASFANISSPPKLQLDLDESLMDLIPPTLLSTPNSAFYLPNAVYRLHNVHINGLPHSDDERPLYLVPNNEIPDEFRQKQVHIVHDLYHIVTELTQATLKAIRKNYSYRYGLDAYGNALLYMLETRPEALCSKNDPYDWLLNALQEANPEESEMQPSEFLHLQKSIDGRFLEQ